MPAMMHPMLNTAVKAARRAGTIINRASQNLDILTVTTKAANDYVSEVDRAAEDAIVRVLQEAYPSHAILAEAPISTTSACASANASTCKKA